MNRTDARGGSLIDRWRYRYRSLFDRINPEKNDWQGYHGSLANVLSELEVIIPDPHAHSRTNRLILHGARIVRAVVEWKTAHPEHASDTVRLMDESLRVCSAIYEQNTKALLLVGAFRKSLQALPYGDDLLKANLDQQPDTRSWAAYAGKRSKKTAERIKKIAQGGNVLFIPLAHAAVPIGIDVALRYRALTGNTGSVVYPVRYSRYKAKDPKPSLLDIELTHLREAAQGKTVVILDDDVVSGDTAAVAKKYFSKTVFPDTRVHFFTNSIGWAGDEEDDNFNG